MNVNTYVEDGEFNNDSLDGTFGRRIYLNGSYKLGWFKHGGKTLHGYGIDCNGNTAENIQ